jgi:hypothetical protein
MKMSNWFTHVFQNCFTWKGGVTLLVQEYFVLMCRFNVSSQSITVHKCLFTMLAFQYTFLMDSFYVWYQILLMDVTGRALVALVLSDLKYKGYIILKSFKYKTLAWYNSSVNFSQEKTFLEGLIPTVWSIPYLQDFSTKWKYDLELWPLTLKNVKAWKVSFIWHKEYVC